MKHFYYKVLNIQGKICWAHLQKANTVQYTVHLQAMHVQLIYDSKNVPFRVFFVLSLLAFCFVDV